MAAQNEGQLYLVVQAPNGDVREIELLGPALVIGRDESADIRVDDRKVSRRHASFRLVDGEPWVEDLGSSNGVRLNDQKIDKRARVRLHDEVRVGGFKMFLKEVGTRGSASTVDLQDSGVSLDSVGGKSRTAPVPAKAPGAERGPLNDLLPRLIGLDPPTRDRVFVLQRGENIVGRLEECDVPILDGSVSRQHARIVFTRQRVTVTDLGSSNGVFVNDLRVDMAELAEGDTLRVGNVAFTVRMPPELALSTPAPLETRARARKASRDRRWLTMGAAGLTLATLVLLVAFALQLRRSGGTSAWNDLSARVGQLWARTSTAGRVLETVGDDEPFAGLPAVDAPPVIPELPADTAMGSPTPSEQSATPQQDATDGPDSTGEAGAGQDPSRGAGAAQASTPGVGADVDQTAPPSVGAGPSPSRDPSAEQESSGAAAAPAASPSSASPGATPGIAAEPSAGAKAPGAVLPSALSTIGTTIPTATSPFSRRTSDGLPINLPEVDPAFDFDGFVATAMDEAGRCERSGDFACVRGRLFDVLMQDPINQDARAFLDRIDKVEAAEAAMAEADRLVARGNIARALRVLAEAPEDGPRAEAVQQRSAELKERAIAQELTIAAKEANRRGTWKRAHQRYKYVLKLDPNSMVALDGLRGLERKMRRKRIAFSPYRPPSQRQPTTGEDDAIRRQFEGDNRLIAMAKTYRRGALDEAERAAGAAARSGRGSQAVTAKAMKAAIREVRSRFKRTKTEITNDPDRAWAMLMELERFERRILPRGVKSFIVRELEVDLSEAFADGGQTLFEGRRYEDAFQRWESGYKLDPTNPKVLAGLKRLEEQAETLAQEAELNAQRGDRSACEQWKRITRMTRSDADVHRRARKGAIASCR